MHSVDLRLDVLHRVVDREAGRHRAPGRVDVEEDVLLRVLGLEEEELRDDQVRQVVADGRAQDDDAVAEQPRVDVVGALTAAGLLNDDRDEIGVHASDRPSGTVVNSTGFTLHRQLLQPHHSA